MKSALLTNVAVLLLAVPSANADPEVYFAEDASPFWPNTVNELPRIYPGSSLAVADKFRSRLVGASYETFETFARYSSPTNLGIGSGTATLSGSREITRVTTPTQTFDGVFPISGTNCLTLPAREVGFFAIDFSSPQAAFGFFGTDFGEFAGMRIRFIGTNGLPSDIEVPVTRPQESGGCFFLGVISRDDPFVRVSFYRVGDSIDGFGFDDMFVATPAQVLPAQPAGLQAALRPCLWITGTAGAHYLIQYATALPATNWTTLTNIRLQASPFLYTDFTAAEQSRYYRAVSAQ
jgi:hypothetical protein